MPCETLQRSQNFSTKINNITNLELYGIVLSLYTQWQSWCKIFPYAQRHDWCKIFPLGIKTIFAILRQRIMTLFVASRSSYTLYRCFALNMYAHRSINSWFSLAIFHTAYLLFCSGYEHRSNPSNKRDASCKMECLQIENWNWRDCTSV